METEYWVLSIIAIVLALVAGFIGGRMSAPRQRRVEAMEQERDTAREEAEAVRAEVNRHFEESARMFGKLASDYRTFFEQFAQTAQNLGLSEGRARELLEEADPNLVARQPSRPASAAPASTGTGEPDAEPVEESAPDSAQADAPAPSAHTPEEPVATAGSASDERPGDGDREEGPADYEAERDRRG
mgnify:CR=1 FL=1